MKAVVVKEDQSLAWEEVGDPAPARGEVLVRIRATAVNRGDLLQRRGLYPPPPGAPPWMGLEAAGEIEELESGAGPNGQDGSPGVPGPSGIVLKVGQPVCCLLAGGGYAEKVAVDARQVLPIPAGLDYEEAAAVPEAFTTAYLNLFVEAGLRAGESVLVHAGASGVGTAAIQMAKDKGARVITTVGTPRKADRVRALGADVIILHRSEDVTERLRALAGAGPGIDVALDCLGGEDLARHLPLMNPYGRWVVIGLMSGRDVRLDLRSMMSKRIRLIGSVLRARSPEEKGRILAQMRADLWPRIEAGAIRPLIHRVFPIEEAASAQAVLESKENVGKVVLRVAS